jgi:hypothetical protein
MAKSGYSARMPIFARTEARAGAALDHRGGGPHRWPAKCVKGAGYYPPMDRRQGNKLARLPESDKEGTECT